MIRINKITDSDFQLIDTDNNCVIHQFDVCGLLMDFESSISFKWGDMKYCEIEYNKMVSRSNGSYYCI